MHRRDFLQLSAGLAAFAAAPAPGATSGSNGPGMLTGIALAHDCAAVCIAYDAVAPAVKQALSKRLEIVALGNVIPSGARRLPAMLESKEERRQALALGFVIHRAAERTWPAASNTAEAGIYQDAHLLRQAIPNTSMPMKALLEDTGRRLMIGIHTFEPDAEDVENWIARLIDWDERTHRMYSEYAAAYSSPDSGKLKRYVEAVNFYDASDPLIAMAPELRRGDRVAEPDLQAAMSAPPKSVYGKALRESCKHVIAASDFVAGKSGADALRSALSLG